MFKYKILNSWKKHFKNNWFDLFFDPMINIVLNNIKNQININNNLLELGCSDGMKSNTFQKLGFQTIGIDVNLLRIKRAKMEYPKTMFLCGDINNLPFTDSSFDIIFSFSVLQYSKWNNVLKECLRVLKTKGSINLIENLYGNLFARIYRLFYKYNVLKYRNNQIPIKYIKWNQQSIIKSFFPNIRFETFHLLTPVNLIIPIIKNKLIGNPMNIYSKKVYDFFYKIDLNLLKIFPMLANYSWMIVIYGVKED